MPPKLPDRRFLALTLAAAAVLGVLVSLGVWQLARKAWKETLIARIGAEAHAAPVSLETAGGRHRNGGADYLHVAAAGRFEHGRELYFWAPDPRLGPGVHVYTPLRLADGRVVFVNRGFVPEALKPPGRRLAGQLPGEVTITGLVRSPEEAGILTPASSAGGSLWHVRDLPGMMRAAFGETPPEAVPFFIEADALPENPGGWPKGGVTRLGLPNRHLGYALTWFALAGTLAAVYAVFAVNRVQNRT